jgi:hypothetical protein
VRIVKTGGAPRIVVVPIRGGGGGGGRRRRGRRRITRRRGRGRRRRAREEEDYGYAMENPMDATELFVGGLMGLAGFGSADVLDRFLATHALTDKQQKDAAGNELYADTPPSDGSYKGLFNATAVLAPMNLPRWGAGIALAAVPIIMANWIRSGAGRSALQFFGFGAGVRVLGKGFQDLMGMVFKKTSFGQRLYDGEMRASALKAGDGSEASLPSSGLGAPAIGCGACANCITGVGTCCGGKFSGMTPNLAPPGGQGVPVPVAPPAPPSVSPPVVPPVVPPPVVPPSTNIPPGVSTRTNIAPPMPPATVGYAGVPPNGSNNKFAWGHADE